MEKPLRKNFPKGKDGDRQYAEAKIAYEQWVKEQEARTKLNIPPIKLPGISPEAGISDIQAKSWFKYSGATASKGTEARGVYDRFVNQLQRAGIPKTKWQAVWNDAVDWVGTPGSGATGDPSQYLNVYDPSQYLKSGETGRYGTTKSKQSTVTEYSTSSAAADLTAAYKAELGMEPGQEDIAAYQKAVNLSAKKEPAVYTATTTTAPGKGGITSTSTSAAVSQTGFDPTRFAVEFARSNPQYAENFAARNFMGLIEASLNDPNRIGAVFE